MARKYLKIVRRVPHPEEEQPAEERPPEEQPAEEEPAEEQLAEEEQPAEERPEPLQLLGVKMARDGVPVDPEWIRIMFLIPYYGENEVQVRQNLPDLLRRELVSLVRRSIETQEFFMGTDLDALRNSSDSEVIHAVISSLMAERNKGKKRRKIGEAEGEYRELSKKEIEEEKKKKRRRKEEKEEEERRRQIEEEERRAWGDPDPDDLNADGWN